MVTSRRTEPLRVHLVHQSFGDYVSALVDGFADNDDVEMSVTSLTSGPAVLSGLRLADGGAVKDHTRLTVPRFRDPRSPISVFKAVSRILNKPCDVIHWQAAGNPWVDAVFSMVMGRKPTLVTVHDMVPHPGDANVLPGTFPAIRRVARKADVVTVHAPHVRRQAMEAGVDGGKIHVVAHGELATRYLDPAELPLPPATEPNVLFFGRAQGYKGLDLLVEAMTILNRDRIRGRLVVAGSGPSIAQLFPDGASVPPWCTIRSGHIPSEDVPQLFQEAAVVALPYREASQSGVAALTAGFGRPVVATAVPGLVDIIEDGVTGVLVEPDSPERLADGLASVLEDRSLALDLGRMAHGAAETRLSWPVITTRLQELYLKALDGSAER